MVGYGFPTANQSNIHTVSELTPTDFKHLQFQQKDASKYLSGYLEELMSTTYDMSIS